MHVIKKKTLDAYAHQFPEAAEPLRVWRKLMERQRFRDLVAVRTVWPTADFVDPYTIFNIKGNHYRLVTQILYVFQRVYIIEFLTHAAYDRWTDTHRRGRTR
jgi:mRNA interferase HigB